MEWLQQLKQNVLSNLRSAIWQNKENQVVIAEFYDDRVRLRACLYAPPSVPSTS